MWIHLVALGLINGASPAAAPTPPTEVRQFFNPWASQSSKKPRKEWPDKVKAQEQLEADKQNQADAAKANEAAAVVELKALEQSLKTVRQQTDATRRNLSAVTKAIAQQQALEAFRQALIEQEKQAQLLFYQDEDDALCALLLSL